MTSETKTARRTLAEELLAQHETIKSLSQDIRGLQIEVARLKARFDSQRGAGDLRAPIPVFTGGATILEPTPHVVIKVSDPQCAGPAPEGGSRKDRPLMGFQQRDGMAETCDCGEPASEHGCPS